MGLDAGTVKGRLDLDTVGFHKGFEEAHTHAETEGGHIREVFESIAEVATEVAGPAFAQFGQQLQSAFAGFAEGPYIGVINALGVAMGAVKEVAEGTAEHFDQVGIAAEKAGVSVEFLSNLANIAKTADVPLESLTRGFKILEQTAEEAAEGNKQAEEAMKRVGISAAEAAELAKHPQELFERVKDSLEHMTDASERNLAAQKLMGKGGQELIPIMTMSAEETEHLSRVFDSLNATVTKADAALGKSAKVIETEISAAWAGIEAAVSRPILAYFQGHMKEIEATIVEVTGQIITSVGIAWEKLSGIASRLSAEFGPTIHALEPVYQLLNKIGEWDAQWQLLQLKVLGEAFVWVASIVKDVAVAAFDRLKPVFDAMVDGFKENLPALQALGRSFMELATIVGGELWSEIKKVAGMVGGEFQGSFTGIIPAIADAIRYLSHLQAVVLKDLTESLEFLKPYMAGLAAAMSYIADVAVDVMGPSLHVSVVAIEAIWAVLKKLNDLIENAVMSTFDAFTADVHAVGTAIDWAESKASAFLHTIEAMAGVGPLNVLGGLGGGGGGGVSASGSGGGTGGGGSIQQVHVAVSVNDTHSTGQLATQIAHQLMPKLQQMRQSSKDNAAGEAAIAMARMSMGGDA